MARSNQNIASRAVIARRDVIAALAASVAAPFVVRHAFAGEPDIVPFRYAASDDALADLKQRLRRTRLPDGETTTDWSQGVPHAKLRALLDRWANSYDWRKVEARLNAHPQFRTEIDGLAIHFLHVRSPHAHALPLIMTHGWPSTVLEFMKIIAPLTNPTAHGGGAADAFHLVLPSLPGFAFSDKPAERGWNMDRTARAWGVLMDRLGYRHYVAQGGDWGSFVTTRLAQQKPLGLAAIHLTMPQVQPDQLPSTLSEDEQRAVDRVKHWQEKNFAYFLQQATRPQTLAYGLADSPAGQAAWIYDIYAYHAAEDATVDSGVPLDDVLNEITLYWLTNSAASSAKFYFEQHALGLKPNLGKVDLPVGCTIFPHDLHAPRRWAEQFFPNLVYWNEAERGGHFAPLEVPELFVRELRNGFRSLANLRR